MIKWLTDNSKLLLALVAVYVGHDAGITVMLMLILSTIIQIERKL